MRHADVMSVHLGTSAFVPARLERLLTIDEVARLLSVSRGSVYALIRSGELVPIRVPERLRFEPADVREYLKRHREAGP